MVSETQSHPNSWEVLWVHIDMIVSILLVPCSVHAEVTVMVVVLVGPQKDIYPVWTSPSSSDKGGLCGGDSGGPMIGGLLSGSDSSSSGNTSVYKRLSGQISKQNNASHGTL